MKNCPVCYARLDPFDYEGFRVFRCTACKGVLLSSQRIETIKRAIRKTTPELKTEASDFKGSTDRSLKCPRCRLAMHKEPLNLPVLKAQIDVCDPCALIWLDPGELALIQLTYEASQKHLNVQQMKERIRQLEADPVRKAAFEADLANLADELVHPSILDSELNELLDPHLDEALPSEVNTAIDVARAIHALRVFR